ncbi:MAG: rRNA maturation RNase YbeY [Anaerolineales bacterium]|jgi:probable rRNA maturation factor
MKYAIHFRQEVEAVDLEASLRQAALETLKAEEAASGSMTLVLTNEKMIRDLNKEFAGLDQPTDVLAFPESDADPDEEGLYYGDVIVALPIAHQQAELAGHSTEEECALLVVHGTLHLLGYDHGNPAEKADMWSRQTLILERLGLPDIEP